jgi:hypothetical protein
VAMMNRVRRRLREESGRVPRVSRLMALALKFQGRTAISSEFRYALSKTSTSSTGEFLPAIEAKPARFTGSMGRA